MATQEPIDVNKAIRDYLIGESDLTDELEDAAYIFGPPGIPDHLVSSMPCKCITYLRSGGLPTVRLPLSRVRIEFRCYGLTNIEANLIERKLALVLDKHVNTEINDYCMFSAHKASEAQDLVEPIVEWPYVWIPYNLIFNQTVT